MKSASHIFWCIEKDYLKAEDIEKYDLAEKDNERTPIVLAAAKKYFKMVKLIADTKKTDEKDTYCYGSALISLLAYDKISIDEKYECALSLIKAGASKGYSFTDTGNSCLHVAVLNNQLKIVSLLLEHGFNLSSQNNENKTPIQLASIKGYFDIVKVIADTKKSDVDDSFHFGSALLMLINSDINVDEKYECALSLIKSGAIKYWHISSTKNACFHLAVMKNQLKIVSLLLTHDFDLSEKNKEDKTPIQIASSNGYFDIVKLIADTKKTDENDSYNYGNALVDIVSNDKISDEIKYDLVYLLLKAGANPNRQETESKNTALHIATMNGKIQLVSLLLHYDADIALTNKDAMTAVQIARKENKKDIFDLLERQLSFTDSLFEMLESGEKFDFVILKRFIKNADLSLKNKNNKTLIQYAYDNQYYKVVKLIADKRKTDHTDSFCYGDVLLDIVSNVEIKDDDQYDCTLALVKAGANMSLVFNDTKNNCLHVAVLNNKEKLVETLITYNADLSVANINQKTPIQLACDKGYFNIVKLIAITKKTNTNDTFCYGHALTFIANDNTLEIEEQNELARCLLKAGAFTNNKLAETENTALHVAVLNTKITLLSMLLSFGADLSIKNKDGKLPIHLAYDNGYFDLVHLIAQTIKTNVIDLFGYGDVLLSVIENDKLGKNEQYNLAYSLLKGGASANSSFTATANTALHIAVMKDRPELVALLITYGANIKYKNNIQKTPKELSIKCYNQGYNISVYNKFIPGILLVLSQAIRQDHELCKLLLVSDIANILLRESAGGFIINMKYTDKKYTTDIFIETHKKICLQKETEKNRIEADRIRIETEKNRRETETKVISFSNKYKQPRFFFEPENCTIFRSEESQQLVEKLLECKDSPENILSHIHDYLNNISLEKLENGCRAIDYLLEMGLINQETIEQYKTAKYLAVKNYW